MILARETSDNFSGFGDVSFSYKFSFQQAEAAKFLGFLLANV